MMPATRRLILIIAALAALAGAPAHAGDTPRGQCAFVPFAGADDLTRPHSETQDTIELGQTVGGARDDTPGFRIRRSAELTRVVVVSEFGRTFRRNGSRNPDHGRV